MIQKYVLVFILIIIVIVLFFKSLNVEHFYNKWQPWKQSDIKKCKTQNPEEVEEEKDTNEDYCCSNMETKTVNYWNKDNDEVKRPEFKNKNIHYFLTSGCYSCIKNFKGGVDLLADPDNDPNCKKTTQA